MSRNSRELPAAVYAAAGAGEAAYEQLRRLPEVAVRTVRTAGERAEALRKRLRDRDRDLETGLQQVRDSAMQGVATLVSRAATVQEQAVTGYRKLVVRGERLVNDRFGVTTGHAESVEPPTKVEVVVGEPQREPKHPKPKTESKTGPKPEAKDTAGTGNRGVGKTGGTSPGKQG